MKSECTHTRVLLVCPNVLSRRPGYLIMRKYLGDLAYAGRRGCTSRSVFDHRAFFDLLHNVLIHV